MDVYFPPSTSQLAWAWFCDRRITGKWSRGFADNPAVLYLGGVMGMLAGLLMITFHNIWSGGWIVILTVLGWAALIKGTLSLVLPDLYVLRMLSLAQKSNMTRVWGGFALVLGLIIGYFSFLA